MKSNLIPFQAYLKAVENLVLLTMTFVVAAFMITLVASRRWDWLILAPSLLAFGWLAILLGFRASVRAHRALITTTAILAVSTAAAYWDALSPDWSGGCMSGLIFFFFPIPLTIGFPIAFTVCWFLYGLKGDA